MPVTIRKASPPPSDPDMFAGRALHATCKILGWLRWDQLSEASKREYQATAERLAQQEREN